MSPILKVTAGLNQGNTEGESEVDFKNLVFQRGNSTLKHIKLHIEQI